jgi:sigma-B regulation protein RsbU (phosphoserine phosphatase)
MQGIFAAQSFSTDGPAATIARVNQALYRRGIENRFVTVMYGALVGDGSLTYCNAGHNPPLVVGTSSVRRLERGGPILGLFDAVSFEEETVRLSPGDCVVIFSDGVSEALSAAGEEFGEARIITCLDENKGKTPADMLNALIATVRDFTKGAPQSDDVTALVVRYSG